MTLNNISDVWKYYLQNQHINLVKKNIQQMYNNFTAPIFNDQPFLLDYFIFPVPCPELH